MPSDWPAIWMSGAICFAAFYEPADLMALMREAGFATVSRLPLTFGIVSVYMGVKD